MLTCFPEPLWHCGNVRMNRNTSAKLCVSLLSGAARAPASKRSSHVFANNFRMATCTRDWWRTLLKPITWPCRSIWISSAPRETLASLSSPSSWMPCATSVASCTNLDKKNSRSPGRLDLSTETAKKVFTARLLAMFRFKYCEGASGLRQHLNGNSPSRILMSWSKNVFPRCPYLCLRLAEFGNVFFLTVREKQTTVRIKTYAESWAWPKSCMVANSNLTYWKNCNSVHEQMETVTIYSSLKHRTFER